jgi:hypothetical protein
MQVALRGAAPSLRTKGVEGTTPMSIARRELRIDLVRWHPTENAEEDIRTKGVYRRNSVPVAYRHGNLDVVK